MRCWDCGQDIDIDTAVTLAREEERERILTRLDSLEFDFRLAGNYPAVAALREVLLPLRGT